MKEAPGQDRSKLSDGYHTFEELYQHRHALFLNLLRLNTARSWASKIHHDGTSFEGWFVAGMDIPGGQISYHLPNDLWSLMEDMGIAKDRAPEWDGHTAKETCFRLTAWAIDSVIPE